MKKFVLIAARGFILLLLFCGLLIIASGWIINSSISHILRTKNISNITVHADRVTPWTAVIRSSLGDPEQPAISLPRIEIEYSPGALAQGRINSATVDGAVIQAVAEDGEIRLKNFIPPSSDTSRTPSSLPVILPLGIDSLQLNNCRLVLIGNDFSPIHIIVNGQLHFGYRDAQKRIFEIEEIRADFQTSGTFQSGGYGSMQFDKDTALSLHLDMPDLSNFAPLIRNRLSGLAGKGQLRMDISLSNNLQSIKEIAASLQLSETLIDTGTLQIFSTASSPILFTSQGSKTELDYQLSNINIAGRVPAVASIEGKIYPAGKIITGSGQVSSDLIKTPLNMDFETDLQSEQQNLSFRLWGKSQQLVKGDAPLETGPFSLHGQLTRSSFDVNAKTELQVSSLTFPEYNLLLEDISADFSYDTDKENTEPPGSGNVAVKAIHFSGENLAGLTGKMTTTPDHEVFFDAVIDGHLANPVQLSLDGTYSAENQLELQLRLPSTRVDNLSLPAFVSLPEGLEFSGDLQAQGSASFDGSMPAGSLNINFSQGSLDMVENNLSMSGISTDIFFPYFPQLQSSPSQILTIEEIGFGSIQFTNGELTYRIENDTALFIEKSRFNWCGGRVEGGSLRIRQDSPEFSTTFYCDRLQFSELLNQFSITGTEGDASLNGRLPVSLSESGLIFDDGFLFSTPGNSGIVRFTNSDMLRDSMPNMGEAAYLDYSLQALDNFSYNWTRLTFNSQGDDLLVSMQIDGKPAEPLPFGYRNGQLVSNPKGGGIQHPIRLDVNFHLPLAEMFKYGQNLQSIMENM